MTTGQEILDFYAGKGKSPPPDSASSSGATAGEDILKWYTERAAADAPPPAPVPQFVDPATGAMGGPTPSMSAPDGLAQQSGPVIGLAERFKQNPVSDRLAGTQDAAKRLLGLDGPSAMSVEAERIARGEEVRQQGGSLGDIMKAQGYAEGSPVAAGFGAAPVPSGGSIAGIVGANRLAAAPVGNSLIAAPAPIRPGEPHITVTPPAADPYAPVAPAAPGAESVPKSLGAAASGPGTAPNLAPAQEAAYRASAEGRKLLEPQPVGIADNTAYVPGVSATTAEIEQTVNAAREAKAANIAHPEVSQAAKEMAAENSDRRAEHFSSMAGDEITAGNLKGAQKEQLDSDYPAAFKGAGVPDTKPIVSAIQDKLSTPRGRQNEQLQAYVKPLIDRLQNADGTPKILDAEELYGFRESLNRMRSRASQSEKPGLEHVAGEIGDLITATDKQIEAAAPGYRQYMDNYSAAQRGIDEQQILQKHEPKLFDAQNHMTYSKFQTFMRQVVDARGAPGLNPYKSISDETMAKLWNIRDDLRRSASAAELARAPGSDTAQNLVDLLKRGAVGAVRLGVHGAANYVAPVLGSMAVNTGEAMLASRSAARAQRKGVTQGLQNLNPNRLLPPQD